MIKIVALKADHWTSSRKFRLSNSLFKTENTQPFNKLLVSIFHHIWKEYNSYLDLIYRSKILNLYVACFVEKHLIFGLLQVGFCLIWYMQSTQNCQTLPVYDLIYKPSTYLLLAWFMNDIFHKDVRTLVWPTCYKEAL